MYGAMVWLLLGLLISFLSKSLLQMMQLAIGCFTYFICDRVRTLATTTSIGMQNAGDICMCIQEAGRPETQIVELTT